MQVTVITNSRNQIPGTIRGGLGKIKPDNFKIRLVLSDGRVKRFSHKEITAIRVETQKLSVTNPTLKLAMKLGLESKPGVRGFFTPLSSKVNLIFPHLKELPQVSNT